MEISRIYARLLLVQCALFMVPDARVSAELLFSLVGLRLGYSPVAEREDDFILFSLRCAAEGSLVGIS